MGAARGQDRLSESIAHLKMTSEGRVCLGLADVKSSIIWAHRRGKREHQMKGYIAEQKVSDWQMNA